MRGAQTVKEIAKWTPVLTSIAVCVEVKDKLVIQPKKDKPKKVGPPKVKVNFTR